MSDKFTRGELAALERSIRDSTYQPTNFTETMLKLIEELGMANTCAAWNSDLAGQAIQDMEKAESRVAELEALCRDVEGYIEPCPPELRERLRAVNRGEAVEGPSARCGVERKET